MQHVARLDGAARAGGPGRHGHTGLVEEDDQGLALHPGEADVEVAGHPGRAVHRSPPPRGRRPPGRRPAGHAGSLTRADVWSRSATVADRAAAMPTMPATLWVPLRRSRSCPPPWITGGRVEAVAGDEGPDPLGPTELVGADGHQVGLAGDAGHIEPGHRLYGVGVEQRAGRPLPDDGHGLVERLHGTDLVVDRHHRHQTHLVRTGGGQLVEVDAAVLVGGHLAEHSAGPSGQGPAGQEHGVVLHGRADQRRSAPGGWPWPPPSRRRRPGCRPRSPRR